MNRITDSIVQSCADDDLSSRCESTRRPFSLIVLMS